MALKFSRRNNTTSYSLNLNLFNKSIIFVEKHKFLGVIFDKRLTFQSHIEHVKSKANSKLNIIKILRCSKYGADANSLLKILSSIVLPTIDYASIIYSSTSETRMKMLNPILNTGIRLSLGAFKTSPASSLQVLASIPPLHLRRLGHLLNYTLNILSLKDHPFLKMMTDDSKIEHFRTRKTSSHPLYIRAFLEFQKIKSKYNIDTHSIEAITMTNLAPWTFTDINVDFSLLYCGKYEMSAIEAQKRFLEIINIRYKDFTHYYTDGSVADGKSGFAVIGEEYCIKKRISDFSSIYTSELLAIRTCVENISFNSQNILIITDSKSSLEGLSDSFSKNTIVQQIRTTLTSLHAHRISFLWIPSHLGIRGNEKVDELAKSSLNERIDISIKFQHTDYKRIVKTYIFDLWNDLWKTENRNKLFQLQNHILPKYVLPDLPRIDVSKLNRLKIGHSLLTHKHIIEKSSPPQCECGQTLTIYHIFNECNMLQDVRNKHKIKDLQILLDKNNFDSIKKFLTEINVYNSI